MVCQSGLGPRCLRGEGALWSAWHVRGWFPPLGLRMVWARVVGLLIWACLVRGGGVPPSSGLLVGLRFSCGPHATRAGGPPGRALRAKNTSLGHNKSFLRKTSPEWGESAKMWGFLRPISDATRDPPLADGSASQLRAQKLWVLAPNWYGAPPDGCGTSWGGPDWEPDFAPGRYVVRTSEARERLPDTPLPRVDSKSQPTLTSSTPSRRLRTALDRVRVPIS